MRLPLHRPALMPDDSNEHQHRQHTLRKGHHNDRSVQQLQIPYNMVIELLKFMLCPLSVVVAEHSG